MADHWELDPNHTSFGFAARHMMVTTVRGHFGEFNGYVDIDGEDYTTARGEVVIRPESISSGVDDRDNHLRSADFFDVEKYPEMKFVSTGVAKTGDNTYRVKGDLTIKDVSRPVELEAEYGGRIEDPFGNDRVALTVSGKINRKDWGLNWNMAVEAGGVLVGDQIKLEVEATFLHPLPVAVG
jgi:polyisoprenoid-binding protein YceI